MLELAPHAKTHVPTLSTTLLKVQSLSLWYAMVRVVQHTRLWAHG